MREIKFRGKDSDGEWWYGSLAWFPDSQSAHIIPCGSCKNEQVICDFVEVDPDTVGQYTGFKDVNSTEIYEGDIIKEIGGKYKVEYAEGAFCLHIGSTYWPHSCWPRTIEIVGNIHDKKRRK